MGLHKKRRRVKHETSAASSYLLTSRWFPVGFLNRNLLPGRLLALAPLCRIAASARAARRRARRRSKRRAARRHRRQPRRRRKAPRSRRCLGAWAVGRLFLSFLFPSPLFSSFPFFEQMASRSCAKRLRALGSFPGLDARKSGGFPLHWQLVTTASKMLPHENAAGRCSACLSSTSHAHKNWRQSF